MKKQIENNLNNQQQKQFDLIFDQILGSEGGKVNDKNDRGGKTNRTQKTYDSFCTIYGIPKKDVCQLTVGEAKIFYRTTYQECKCDKITNPELAYVYFDAVVNHGQHRAVALLQKSIGGLTVDGKICKDTLSEANSGNGKKIAQQIIQERRNLYAAKISNNPKQDEFINGWKKRMEKLDEDVEKQVITNQTSSQSRSTSASSNGSKGQVLQQEKNQGGIDCNPVIKNLNRIRGVEKMNARFLIDSQENIIFSDLITVLSVYADPNIKPEHKGICFSLDPIILPNQREFTQQEKVCWPDKVINRNIIQDSELAKVMFESDYLLKLMSLGVQADGVTPFQYPKQLVELGLKPCLDFESAKNSNANKPLMFRFWLVPQQCSYSRKNDSFIINDIKVMCQSRQVERVNNNLQDKTVQDQNDISYKFAHKFTQLYDQIAQHYPIFNRLKQVFKAVALGKWMYQNNLKIDLQLLMNYNKKVNNDPKTIPILKTEKKGEEQKTPIYFTQNEKIEMAKEYLKEKGHSITDDLIDQVVKQIPDLKGYQIESAIQYTEGGIDPNCQNMEEQEWPYQQKIQYQYQVEEQKYVDIPIISLKKCSHCERFVENNLINLNQESCSLHNDYTCFRCLQLITQNDVKCQMKNNKQVIFHNCCHDEYQKDDDETTDDETNNQEEEEFLFIMEKVFGFEGGYVDDPNDHGGKTNFGITQATYEGFLKAHSNQGFPKTVKELTKDQAQKFYKWYYADSKATLIKNKYSRLLYFDSYVLLGTQSRLALLQASLGSNISDTTTLLKQINEQDQTAFQKKYLDERENLHKKNAQKPNQGGFLNGWLNRIKELRKLCKLA